MKSDVVTELGLQGERGVAALVYLNTAEETSGGTQFYKVRRRQR